MEKDSQGEAQHRQVEATGTNFEQSSPEAHVLAATEQVAEDIQRWAAVVEKYDKSIPWQSLPEGSDNLFYYATDPEGLSDNVRELIKAWQIVHKDEPVAGEWPQAAEKGGKTIRWHPPLAPRQILYSRRLVIEGTVPSSCGYREHARANAAYYFERDQQRAAELSTQCGEPTVKGTPCKSLPVYVPPQGFSAGVGCGRHINEADAQRVARIYDQAVEGTPCRGCGAAAGISCLLNSEAGRLSMVDGQWPHERSFKGRKVHDVRLIQAVDGH